MPGEMELEDASTEGADIQDFASFMKEGLGEDSDGEDSDEDDGSDDEGEDDNLVNASGALIPEDDDDEPDDRAERRKAGQERLAQKVASKERELTVANKRIRDLESQISSATGTDLDLIEDRVAYVRGQIAKGLGTKIDDPRVAAELRELLDDLTFSEISEEQLQANADLRRQVEERRNRAMIRKGDASVQKRMADLERREALASAEQVKHRVTGQLDGYLRGRATNIPFLVENPDAHPTELVYDALQMAIENGADLRTDQALTKEVERIVAALEQHYEGMADKLSAVKAKKAAANNISSNKSPKMQSGRTANVQSKAKQQTVTSGRSNGGRGSAPVRESNAEESFEEFMRKGIRETSKRRSR